MINAALLNDRFISCNTLAERMSVIAECFNSHSIEAIQRAAEENAKVGFPNEMLRAVSRVLITVEG